MLFVPNPIMREEKPLETVSDLIKSLDQWVLKYYDELENFQVSMLKSDCFSILKCYYENGKIVESLGFDEIKTAVENFMESRLWVPKRVTREAGVAPQVEFDRWQESLSL